MNTDTERKSAALRSHGRATRVARAALLIGLAVLFHELLTHNIYYTLMPHVAILRALYGISFRYVEDAGYLAQCGVLITESCVGARLFVSAFLVLALGFPSSRPGWARKALCDALYFAGALSGALLITIMRIGSSLPFLASPHIARIHQAISLLLYFGPLFGLYVVASAMQRRRGRNHGKV